MLQNFEKKNPTLEPTTMVCGIIFYSPFECVSLVFEILWTANKRKKREEHPWAWRQYDRGKDEWGCLEHEWKGWRWWLREELGEQWYPFRQLQEEDQELSEGALSVERGKTTLNSLGAQTPQEENFVFLFFKGRKWEVSTVMCCWEVREVSVADSGRLRNA